MYSKACSVVWRWIYSRAAAFSGTVFYVIRSWATVSEFENRWALPDWHSALLWSRARNAQGIKTILDILGEDTAHGDDGSNATKAYLALLDSISSERLYASISVKVSALGYLHDRDLCLQNLLVVARDAAARKVGFEIDMEGRSLVNFTLDCVGACREEMLPVTIALQAYLDRTTKDLEAMLEKRARVRLVKGAYAGDTSDFLDIQGRFKALARTLSESRRPFCVGTHDPELIVWSTVKFADLSDKVEFGMLKGLSDRTKLEFVKNKWAVSEYVPFGVNRAAYEDRRKTYLRRLEAIGRAPAP